MKHLIKSVSVLIFAFFFVSCGSAPQIKSTKPENIFEISYGNFFIADEFEKVEEKENTLKFMADDGRCLYFSEDKEGKIKGNPYLLFGLAGAAIQYAVEGSPATEPDGYMTWKGMQFFYKISKLETNRFGITYYLKEYKNVYITYIDKADDLESFLKKSELSKFVRFRYNQS